MVFLPEAHYKFCAIELALIDFSNTVNFLDRISGFEILSYYRISLLIAVCYYFDSELNLFVFYLECFKYS